VEAQAADQTAPGPGQGPDPADRCPADRCPGDELVIRVEDTGPGIPPHHQALLFQKFSMLPASRWDRANTV